jgi:hypothetical protein
VVPDGETVRAVGRIDLGMGAELRSSRDYLRSAPSTRVQ